LEPDARSTIALDQRPPSGDDAALSLAKRIEINLAEPRQDHRVVKVTCRRIAGARKRHSARVFERERASPTFGHDWTHNLTSFTGLQVAFRIPIKCNDGMIGHWQFQAGFKLSAEDLPVRLSATTS
jgi:hypothetical protein